MELCFGMVVILIAILPPEPHFSKLDSLMKYYSKELNSSSALLFPPHITLVRRFVIDDYLALREELSLFLSSISSFRISLTKLSYFQIPPTLFFDVKSSQKISQLHSKLLELVFNFQVTPFNPFGASDMLTPSQRLLAKKYGFPFVKNYFHPHLTLAGSDIKSEDFLERVPAFKEEALSFVMDRIHVLEVDKKTVVKDVFVLKG